MQRDFIIIGGGSAGCILANRLTDAPHNKVLMLEAGRPDYWWDVFIHMPAALTIPIGSKHYDWMYESEPEPFMKGRKIYHARGKVLGGSSSINGMIFQRGNPLDYERWAQNGGMERWGYDHCLPYFKRMETCLAASDPMFRGTSGPLMLERGPGKTPLFEALFEAVQQAGHPLTEDVNGYQQEGFALFDRNIHRGRRMSCARAYYHPVKHRANLELKCRIHVTRILFEKNRAVGVEYLEKGRLQKAHAGEIICCGGAINSPQLLQLSGIGNAQDLNKLGIPVVQDLPGVGENLQDHLEVYIQHRCQKPVSMQPALKGYKKPWIGLQWLFRKGPAATNHFEAGGFLRSNEEVAYPNLMFHFLPLAIRYDGSVPSEGHGYQFHVGPMYADTRGSVKLKTRNPQDKPAIRFNYLSTPNDRKEWLEAVRTARHILRQPAFEAFDGGEISPGGLVQSDEEIMDWVARDGETALHPSCTCKMGVSADAVVAPDSMQVHGTEGLRVVDASVMPSIPNGNLLGPVAMLAEKASDLILGQTPLPAETPGFYQKTDL